MAINLDITVTHSQGADAWVGMWPPTIRQILKSRFDNSCNNANSLTHLSKKRLVFVRKALNEVSKILAEAVSELWIEHAAAIKLIVQTELTQPELDQQQWTETPLPSN